MKIWMLGPCLIAALVADPAYAACTSTSLSQTANLTPQVVQGRIAATTQTFTITAGCTRPFYIAISAVAVTGSTRAAAGFDAAIGYTATASVGGIITTVTASSAGAVAPKQVSALTAPGLVGTAPITVTVRPVPGNRLMGGSYAGHLVVTVCESPSGC